MKPEIKKVKSRNYLFIDGKKTKMIPNSYIEIPIKVILESVKDKSKIFLNHSERFNIEYFIFIEEIKRSEKYVFELIEKAKFKEVRFVKVKFGFDRYELLFDNGVRLKCPSSFSKLKLDIKTIKSST